MKAFFKEFKEFIATGNMIELAIAVILGSAVKAVIDSFTKDVVMQLIAAIGGKKDFSKLLFTVNKAQIFYGNVLTQILNLLIVGFVLFLIIKAYNHMKRKPEVAPEAPAVVSELSVLLEIRDSLKSRG